MAVRVAVRLAGQMDLDDIEDLRAQLARDTELGWHEESLPDDKHLGIAETFLIGVIAGMTARRADAALGVIIAQVRASVKRWQDQWLDPPDVEVVTEDLPEALPETEDLADPEA